MHPRPLPTQPGQESVWDYPRPPRLERVPERIRVLFGGSVLADTVAAWRVLETSHPPTYYLPPGDVADEVLQRLRQGTVGERVEGSEELLGGPPGVEGAADTGGGEPVGRGDAPGLRLGGVGEQAAHRGAPGPGSPSTFSHSSSTKCESM